MVMLGRYKQSCKCKEEKGRRFLKLKVLTLREEIKGEGGSEFDVTPRPYTVTCSPGTDTKSPVGL